MDRGRDIVQKFALVAGIVYVVVGVAGFLPAVLTGPPADAPPLRVNTGYGYLFGLFPVNILHTLVHLAIGIWGVLAARTFGAARGYAVSLAVIYGALTVMGLVPGLRTTFGLVPLFGHDVWLHALTAAAAAYFATRAGRGAIDLRSRARRAA